MEIKSVFILQSLKERNIQSSKNSCSNIKILTQKTWRN